MSNISALTNMIKYSDDNDFVNILKEIRDIKNFLKPISMPDILLSKYSSILYFYPLKDSKRKVYLTLSKKQRVGMLNRHILGVANKLNIYQSIIKNIVLLKSDYKKYKKYMSDDSLHDDFWTKRYHETQRSLSQQYNLLLDIITEELDRRNNIKYARKKKMENILQK